jgi:altronate dehydratase large subunit
LILPLHQALSTAARDIAEATPGAVAISHDWSGEIDKDFERITKTFAGFAGNPNIFTTVALTIGPEVETGIIERARQFSPTPLVEIKLSDAG